MRSRRGEDRAEEGKWEEVSEKRRSSEDEQKKVDDDKDRVTAEELNTLVVGLLFASPLRLTLADYDPTRLYGRGFGDGR